MRRDAQVYEYDGQQRTLAQIARIAGLSYNVLYSRLMRGMPLEQAVVTPTRRYGKR